MAPCQLVKYRHEDSLCGNCKSVKTILPNIISDTQKGFIKDRFIGENTRLLYDLMHYLEYRDMPGLLLLIDFEKAFNSIELEFLVVSLKSSNFGPSICKWFKTFYVDAKKLCNK